MSVDNYEYSSYINDVKMFNWWLRVVDVAYVDRYAIDVENAFWLLTISCVVVDETYIDDEWWCMMLWFVCSDVLMMLWGIVHDDDALWFWVVNDDLDVVVDVVKCMMFMRVA